MRRRCSRPPICPFVPFPPAGDAPRLDPIAWLLHHRAAEGNGSLHGPGGPIQRPPADHPRWQAPAARPSAATLLSLQRTAGNAAVVTLQRQPKPGKKPGKKPGQKKPPPAWVTAGQAELGQLFPNDKLMSNVVIKDYADLNKTLQGAPFAAWTQSMTEIYVRDLSGFADPKKPATKLWPQMAMRYVLHHEAEHIRQFAGGTGPPRTWQEMLQYEQTAYTNDLAWLASPAGQQAVSDPVLNGQFLKEARKNLADVTGLLDGTKNLTGKKREDALFKGMKKARLIPARTKRDPTLLYRQPP
jgi:hypothetical protein